MANAKNLIGNRFGRLLVVSLADPVGITRKRRAYLCSCDCGSEKIVRSECLLNGMTKSCGCIRIEKIGALNRSHAMSLTPEYKSWAHAKSRTSNQNDLKYEHYGARGIKMCQEWLDSFDVFYNEMGKKPSSNHSLGRIDVDKGYCKENCRWETPSQQARARTDNVLVEIDGVKMILKDACALKGVNYKKISYKLKKKLATVDEVFK